MDNLTPIDILLVDDSDTDAEITLRNFRKRRLTNSLFRVRDGVEALEFVFREGVFRNRSPELPKLILLDLNMPRLSGSEVLKRIKADPMTRSIPVILLTATANADDLAEALRLGAATSLTKPVDFAAFAQAAGAAGLQWIDIENSAR